MKAKIIVDPLDMPPYILTSIFTIDAFQLCCQSNNTHHCITTNYIIFDGRKKSFWEEVRKP